MCTKCVSELREQYLAATEAYLPADLNRYNSVSVFASMSVDHSLNGGDVCNIYQQVMYKMCHINACILLDKNVTFNNDNYIPQRQAGVTQFTQSLSFGVGGAGQRDYLQHISLEKIK